MLEKTLFNDLTIPSTVPRQKTSTREKTPAWCKDNLLWLESRLINKNSSNETSKINMKRNSNLYYHNILDNQTVGEICNPYGLKDFKIPLDFKHYKIENPKIQTLKGEEIKRRFEWKVYVSNRDAVSQKEEQKKQQFFNFIVNKIKSEAYDEKAAGAELQKLQEYLTYDWQEIRELTCDQLLHHYNQYLDLRTIFSRAWEHGIINSEEIISVDEHNGKPLVEACDPKTIYWTPSPENPYIDDSDQVLRIYYVPLGKVIDHYYDYLTSAEISELESRHSERSAYQNFTIDQYYQKDDNGFIIPDKSNGEIVVNNYRANDEYYDEDGNIRIVHARWKSFRKVGDLSFFDENGDPQQRYVDENYKIQKELGETIEWIWITEAWESTRIGEDIFVKNQPRNVQFRQLDNISYCSLGYIGTRIDNGLFDIMRDISVKFDAYAWRTEQGLIKALGKIGILDLSLVPDGWDIDMWMHYATTMGWAVVDSFKEGKKGAAQGKLAGSGGTSANVINMEQGQFIQQNMAMMQYLEGQLDKIVGINNQRQGMLAADAGLQVTREAQQASSNVTESYFAIHDNVKLRTLRALLEVGKWCLRNKTESIQYITSEMTNKIFEVDGDLINEADYGILVGDATNDARTITTLQEAVKIALQTGQVDLIQMMDIFSSDTTSSIKRKVEKSVNEKKQQEQERFEQEQAIQQQGLEQQAQMHAELLADNQADRDLLQYKIDTEAQAKIEVAQINALGFAEDKDVNENDIPDVLEQGKLALEHQKFQADNFDKQQRLMFDKQSKDDDRRLKQEEIASKERQENKKIKAIEIQNKSQELIQKRQADLKEKEIKSKERISKYKAKK